MTPEQKIKHLILVHATEIEPPSAEVTVDNIDALYDALVTEDRHWDSISELREGGVETGLPCEWSRNYESKSVAAQMPDGSWVGWTYWYGGGKHSNPDEIEWMSEAYDLVCAEEEKLVTVRTFTKAEDQPA